MNYVVDEMLELMHYGMPRRSGRYPYGSGDNPYQHSEDFLGRVETMRKANFTYTDEDGKTWTGDTAIAKSLGLSTTQFRTEIGLAKDERRMYQVAQVKTMREDGLGWTEIGRRLGMRESSVRSLLDKGAETNMMKAKETAEFLKKQVDEKGMIDVGTGVERELNISKEKLKEALYILEREGYVAYTGGIPQVTNPGQQTNQKVLCPPHIKPKEGAKAPAEIYDFENIHTIKDYISRDGGQTYEKKFHYPASLDPKRLKILLADEIGPDGEPGIAKDGIIQIRRGVDDLSLGNSKYAQVRILVGEDKYLKGMAVYSDNMPDGVDVVFNSNKKNYADALKKIKNDPDNPFGSLIKDADQGGQYWYDPKTGAKVTASTPGAKLGLINKRADEGDWTEWKDTLPSQFLGKQSMKMIKQQLNLAKVDKQSEYEDICALTNPTIKKHLLSKFADECDSAAVHLKAAALPGQKYHVIVPINTLKDDEVYAPNYDNGTKLALIRYPHGGTFEIPILTVNNKNKLGKEIIGDKSIDAVGINKKVADHLSGADFDGDTVMCIPTHDPAGKVKVTSTSKLKELDNFETLSYQYDKKTVDDNGVEHYYRNGREFKVMKNTGTQMGVITNLITDMTLLGAPQEELARAVKHSMVVIDAEKHKLDYKQSEAENNIDALKRKWQISVDENGNVKYGGASTILSRAKSETSVDKRQGSPIINVPSSKDYDPSKPEGSLIYKTADDLWYPVRNYNKSTGKMTIRTADGKKIVYDVTDKEASDLYTPVKRVDPDTGKVSFTNKTGDITYKIDKRTQQSTRMLETDDAHTLVSEARNPKELAYAEYANSMKALANQARKEMMSTGKIEYSPQAKKTYINEVKSLDDKLNTALLNATRERAALRKANAAVNAKKEADPNMKPGDVKKASQQAMTKYRAEVGSVSRRDRSIKITDKEWEAIQAGAISEAKLKQILNNTDVDELRQRATPRSTTKLSTAKINKIRSMSASNYTLSEIARAVGVSTSAVSDYLKKE